MKCFNCGCELKDGQKNCPECGAYQIDKQSAKKISLKAGIATALVVIIAVVGLTVYYFLDGKDRIERSYIQAQIERVSHSKIIEMYYDDFNGDGTKEAFAVTGVGTDDVFTEGEVWFVKSRLGVNIRSGVVGSINGIVEEDGKKYLSVEITDEKRRSSSYVFGVDDNNNYYVPVISGKYSGIHQQDGKAVTSDGKEITIKNQ
ncbi:MAG: zinc ribbon domain-containing protein [Clostridia bacterium]|nr:zinc ribbon domain-containing protein [Clostridia bacterium]